MELKIHIDFSDWPAALHPRLSLYHAIPELDVKICQDELEEFQDWTADKTKNLTPASRNYVIPAPVLDVKFSVDQLKVSNTDETCALIDSGSKALALKIANRSNKMICSPRQQADFEFEKVKKSLKESSLNFFWKRRLSAQKSILKKHFYKTSLSHQQTLHQF